MGSLTGDYQIGSGITGPDRPDYLAITLTQKHIRNLDGR